MAYFILTLSHFLFKIDVNDLQNFPDKDNLLIFPINIAYTMLGNGCRRDVLGEPWSAFSSGLSPLWRGVGIFEVDMREKEEALEKEEKVGVLCTNIFLYKNRIFQLVKKGKASALIFLLFFLSYNIAILTLFCR